MRKPLPAVFLLLLLLLCASVSADEVRLKGGGKVVGIATEKDGKVIVEVGIGKVAFPKDEVLSIKSGRTPLHEYRDRAAKIGRDATAGEHYELAVWAGERRLGLHERRHLKKTIELDPDHEGARRALGFQLYKGKWLTRGEIQREKGFVKFEGKWMTQAEVELIRRHRLNMEERRMALEEERAKREAEERERRMQMRREYHERMLRLMEEDRWSRRYFRTRSWGGTSLYRPGAWIYDEVVPVFDIFEFLNWKPWKGQVPYSPLPR